MSVRRIRPVKIAHIIDTMAVGGAETLVALLCRLQKKAGHKPSVHCLYALGSLGEQLRQEDIPVVVHGPASSIALAVRLYREFRRRPSDVVHCHNATATIVGAPSSRLACGASIISTRHGLVEPPFHYRRELKYAVAVRSCDWVVGVCKATTRNMLRLPGVAHRKITTVYNAAVPFANKSRRAKPPGLTRAVHVARLTHLKDQATLLRAVALAKPRLPGLVLSIVGDGPLAANLRDLSNSLGLQGQVSFHGEQQNVEPILLESDLFVLSSLSEGLPVSLLEAMSAGLATIVTDVGGMPEVVRSCNCGMTVPPLDPAALADAVVTLGSAPDRLNSLGCAARRCYELHFTPERMAEQYERLYATKPSSVASL